MKKPSDFHKYLINTIGGSAPLLGIAVALTEIYHPELSRPVSIGAIIIFTVLGSMLGIYSLTGRDKDDE